MVISVAKQENLTTPPLCPPKNTGQEYSKKIIYIPGQKGWLFSGQNKKI
jgi:hypothetical protein